jgi:phage tail-like protein
MARYGITIYGTDFYGEKTRLTYSVEPITLLVLSFSVIRVSWKNPSGTFSKIRLVRSHNGYAETAEDGITVWEEDSSVPSISSIDDGSDNPNVTPFVTGRMVYYRMFLFTDNNIWVPAGDANTIAPLDRQTHQKLVSSLPRVLGTLERIPLVDVDPTFVSRVASDPVTGSAIDILGNDLYQFLGGLTLSIEELLSYLDLLRPRLLNIETPISLLPLEFSTLGLTPETNLPIKNQKRLVREAFYMYSRKGTENGIETYVESLTGYAPTLTVSQNLLLNVQDSTFYNSTGNWSPGNATLTASQAQVPATGTKVIDDLYTCQVVTTANAYMKLGDTDPVRQGVPIDASTQYTASCKFRSPASAGTVTLIVTFYDRHGVVTGTAASSSATAADDTWKTQSVTFTSPAESNYAVVEIWFSAAGTYFVDQVCVQTGSSVTYEEARALDILLNAPYENLIKNPSFESNTTFWTATGSPTITRDTDVTTLAYAGTSSAKIVASSAWTFTADSANILVGQYYTASVYAKTSAAMTMTVTAKDALGATVVTATKSINSASWARYDQPILIPAGSDATTLTVSFSGSTGTFFIDCVQLEQSFRASEYFDGSLPNEYGVVWGGTAYNSISYRYPSRDQKIPRLADTIGDWIPENTWWRISTERGLERDILD